METEQLKSAAIEATHAGNISEARSMWLQLCEIDPKENENWLLLSNIDARLGFLQAARNHLNFPIRNNAFDRDIWELAASQSFELGKFDEALRLLHRVLRQDFTDVTVRQKLGDWCLRLNRRRIAACHFMYCVQLTPNDEDLLAKLICSLIVRDDISEACQGLSFLASLNEDQITNRACDSAVELWLSLQTPGTVSSVKVPQTTATSLINKKLANAASRNIENVEHYYSYTAHIRAYTKDVHQGVLARHIAKLSLPTEQGVCSIVEMGAGVGTLGKELCKIEAQTSHAKSSYITGVCLVGEEQHYLNQNTAYDLVVSFDHLMQNVNSISCDVLIINEQVSRFLNEGQLEAVSEILAPKSILAIVGRPQLLTAWLRDNCDQTIVRENGTFILCNQVLESRSPESQATQCLRKSEMEPVIKAMQAVRSGQYDKAVDLSHDFQPDLDRYPSVQFLRGITAQHQKQYKSAAIHFMRCLRSDPAYVDARFHLAACWQSLDKEHAMQRTYRRVLKASSGHQLAAKNLISHYAHLKDFDQVGIFVQQLLLNHPIDGQMRNYASQVVEDSGKQDFKVWLQQFYQQENFLRAAFQESLSNKYF